LVKVYLCGGVVQQRPPSILGPCIAFGSFAMFIRLAICRLVVVTLPFCMSYGIAPLLFRAGDGIASFLLLPSNTYCLPCYLVGPLLLATNLGERPRCVVFNLFFRDVCQQFGILLGSGICVRRLRGVGRRFSSGAQSRCAPRAPSAMTREAIHRSRRR
jgi:hypothetical protein